MVSPLAQAIAFQNSVNPTQSGIAPTDVVGAYKLASQVAEQNYQAKIKQMMGMWGGLASLGSAGILGAKGIWAPALSKAIAGGGAAYGGPVGNVGYGLGVGPTGPIPANAALTDPGIMGGADAASAATDASIAADLGTTAPTAATVASDLAGGAGAAGAADLGGSVAADLGATGAAGLGGSIAADLGAGTAADIGAGVAAEGGADWLLSFLPFLLA